MFLSHVLVDCVIFHRKIDGQRTPRDEKRRATHNEVERRRRDKINNWIDKLAKMLPECEQDHTKQGQVYYVYYIALSCSI
jgi:hypothetical protein